METKVRIESPGFFRFFLAWQTMRKAMALVDVLQDVDQHMPIAS